MITSPRPPRLPPRFRCPFCGAVSHNRNDIANRYCGRCRRYADDELGLFAATRAMRFHILDDDHRPIPVSSLDKWSRWAARHDRRVARDDTGLHLVSTVFIGIGGQMFETMICGSDGEWRDEQWRYDTWDEAVVGHAAALAWIRAHEERADNLASKLLAKLGDNG
jgi:hypothetical protein